MSLKDKLAAGLYRIRNPKRDEDEKEFSRQLGFKRLIILLPFLVAAAIFLLWSLK